MCQTFNILLRASPQNNARLKPIHSAKKVGDLRFTSHFYFREIGGIVSMATLFKIGDALKVKTFNAESCSEQISCRAFLPRYMQLKLTGKQVRTGHIFNIAATTSGKQP